MWLPSCAVKGKWATTWVAPTTRIQKAETKVVMARTRYFPPQIAKRTKKG